MIDQNREHFMGSLAGHCRPCSSAVRAVQLLDVQPADRVIELLLTDAGFEHPRTEMLDLDPPAACVLGHVAPADDAELAARSTARS
jgi:hypothetical protein